MLTAKFDDRKRVVIPQGKPGQIVAIVENPDGTITLSPMKATERKPSILDGLKPMTKAECEKCWGPGSEDPEMDALIAHCASLPVAMPDED